MLSWHPAILPVVDQRIKTHDGFQKILAKEVATCAEVSTEEEVRAGTFMSELRHEDFKKPKNRQKEEDNVFTSFSCDLSDKNIKLVSSVWKDL